MTSPFVDTISSFLQMIFFNINILIEGKHGVKDQGDAVTKQIAVSLNLTLVVVLVMCLLTLATFYNKVLILPILYIRNNQNSLKISFLRIQ